MKRACKIILGLVLFPAFSSFSQSSAVILTRHIIDSITQSPYAYTKRNYTYEDGKNILYESITVKKFPQEETIRYNRFYHRNGHLRKEGLEDPETGRGIYTWFYYDTTGKLYKEYDHTTGAKKLYGIEREPFQNEIDSVTNMTVRFLKRHYGKVFYKKQMRVNVYWDHDRYEPYINTAPDLPYERPKEYTVIGEVVYNDSVSGADISLHYHRDLSPGYCSFIDDTAQFFPRFNIGYQQARAIGKKYGFKGRFYLGQWDEKQKTFFWCSRKTLSSVKTILSEEAVDKILSINARNGSVSISREIGGYNADGFISDYQKPVKDTLAIRNDWKKIEYNGFSFHVPLWYKALELSRNSYYTGSLVLVNGSDSAWAGRGCGISVDPFPVERDTDKVTLRKYKNLFGGKTFQGRSAKSEFYFVNGKLRLECDITESGVAFNCGPVVYSLSAMLKPENADLFLEILKTVHFPRE